MSLSVCLGRRRRTQGTGGMSEVTRWRDQKVRLTSGGYSKTKWSDGSEPYLFYRRRCKAVHCVMLDEKEWRISSRGESFRFCCFRAGRTR